MRRALALLATRVLTTRYGIALLIAMVVFGILGAAKLAAGPAARDDLGVRDDQSYVIITVNPTPGDDGEVSPAPVPQPVTSSGAATPDKVATAFATAWVDHRGKDSASWLRGLRPHSTSSLLDKLSGVDPVGVPADRLAGAVQLVPRGESFVEALVPVDSGLLRLRLIAGGGRWLVDGVDWERG